QWERGTRKKKLEYDVLLLESRDSSNTYGGGDAPDRPEEAGQLQVINWFCLVNIILNVLNGFGL
ncbi:hypothetical protein Tco_0128953, partial [Tanacetum coccineum]